MLGSCFIKSIPHLNSASPYASYMGLSQLATGLEPCFAKQVVSVRTAGLCYFDVGHCLGTFGFGSEID